MNDLLNKLSVSILDIEGEINGGVVLLLCFMIDELPFEIGYWFDKNGDIIISPDDNLLEYLNVNDIKEYEYFNELLYFIHENIPNKSQILKEFVK